MDGRKSDTGILHDAESLISEPKEEFERNVEPEKVKYSSKVFQYQIFDDKRYKLYPLIFSGAQISNWR